MSAFPHEPFDADEARAARIYRALPGDDPSPALDARILAQARDAVAARRARRPWFLGAGMGAAAAAVMAAGLAWQLGMLGPPTGTTSAPAAPPATQPQAREADESRVEVEYIEIEHAPAVPAAAAPPRADKPTTAPRRERAAAAPAAPPAPPPAPAAAEPPVVMAEEVATPPAETVPEAFPADAAASAPPSGPATVAGEAAAPQAQHDGDAEAKRRLGLSRARAALPPWPEDAVLPPAQWLERVRERVQGGDRISAELSLRRFVATHPRHPVPRELQRLLVE